MTNSKKPSQIIETKKPSQTIDTIMYHLLVTTTLVVASGICIIAIIKLIVEFIK